MSKSNNDAFYAWLNAINSAEFRRFEQYGQPLGHDNFNYWVQTWEHRFNQLLVTKTESYFMWQHERGGGRDAEPGRWSRSAAAAASGRSSRASPNLRRAELHHARRSRHKDFITFRNEAWKDTDGERSGFGLYTSNAMGLTHNFTPWLQVRPEIDFFRNWHEPAFDNGRRQNQFMLATDVTLRF